MALKALTAVARWYKLPEAQLLWQYILHPLSVRKLTNSWVLFVFVRKHRVLVQRVHE